MKVLVIGGSGFISAAIVRRLVDAGHKVTILTRGRSAVDGLADGVEAIVADRRQEQALRAALGARRFDVVYDMVAYQPEESRAAAGMFSGRIGRFIHCSTISVYMVSNELQCPITEDQDKAPLMEFFARNPFGMDYGIKKRACEDVLWQAHGDKRFPVSMLRPTFVSGPRDPAKRDFFWIERILDGCRSPLTGSQKPIAATQPGTKGARKKLRAASGGNVCKRSFAT